MGGIRPIELLESSCCCVVQHEWPNVFALSNPDGITVLGRFVAMKKSVGSSHDYRDTRSLNFRAMS
jgi:hypothetical protein